MTTINNKTINNKIGGVTNNTKYKPKFGHIIECEGKLFKVIAIIDRPNYSMSGENMNPSTEIYLRNITKKGTLGSTLKCFINNFSHYRRFDRIDDEHGVYEHEYTVNINNLLHGMVNLERDISRYNVPFKI